MACVNRKNLINDQSMTSGVTGGLVELENHHTGFLLGIDYEHAGTNTEVRLEHSFDGSYWTTVWTKTYTANAKEVLSPLSSTVSNLLKYVRGVTVTSGAGTRELKLDLMFEAFR